MAVEEASQLDSSFGEGGIFSVQANQGCLRVCTERGGSYASALLLQPDGKLVLGGQSNYIGAPVAGPMTPGALIRLNANGSLDSTFGIAGQAPSPPFAIEALAELHGGLLAVGNGPAGIGIERYSADGAPDESFAPGGVRWLRPPGGYPHIAIDTAGRVLVATERFPLRWEAVRYLASGEPDRSFGVGGTVTIYAAPAAQPSEILSTPGGGALLLGSVPVQGTTDVRSILARLTSSGKLAQHFGEGGIALGPVSGGSYYSSAVAAAVAPNGQIVTARGANSESATTRDAEGSRRERLLVSRYSATGQLDRAFGHDGVATTTLPGARSSPLGRLSPAAIAFDHSENAIVAGSNDITTIDTGSAGSWFLTRYTKRGRDCSFGEGGIVFGDARGSATAVGVQTDGRIVIAGDREHAFMAARYDGGGPGLTCPGEGRAPATRRSPRRRRNGRRSSPAAAPAPAA